MLEVKLKSMLNNMFLIGIHGVFVDTELQLSDGILHIVHF